MSDRARPRRRRDLPRRPAQPRVPWPRRRAGRQRVGRPHRPGRARVAGARAHRQRLPRRAGVRRQLRPGRVRLGAARRRSPTGCRARWCCSAATWPAPWSSRVLALVAVDGTPVWVLLGLLLVRRDVHRAVRGRAPGRGARRAARPARVPGRHRPDAGALPGRPGGRDPRRRCGDRAGRRAGRPAPRRGHASCVSAPRAGADPAVAAGDARRPVGAHAPWWRDFRAGWRLVFDDPSLRALVLLGWSAAVFLIAPEAVALAYARDDGAGPAVGAALMASLPAGAAVGAWLVGRLDPLRQVRSIIPLAVAACLPLLADQPGAAVAGGRCRCGSSPALAQGFMVPLMTTVNLVTPPAMRGRVNGLAGAGFATVTAATFLVSGAVADLATPGRRGDRGGGGRAGPGRGGAPGLAARASCGAPRSGSTGSTPDRRHAQPRTFLAIALRRSPAYVRLDSHAPPPSNPPRACSLPSWPVPCSSPLGRPRRPARSRTPWTSGSSACTTST